MASTQNERQIEPMNLSLDQLGALKTQFENELNEMGSQLEKLHGAKNRFLSTKASLNEVSSFPADNRMMIPLSQSLYVPGTIVDPDKYLIELGTGYFCELPAKKGTEIIDRKTRLVLDSISQIDKVVNEKRTQ